MARTAKLEEAKQQSVRLTTEDMAVLEEIQRTTGLSGTTAAVRYAIRQYALANGIDFTKRKRTE